MTIARTPQLLLIALLTIVVTAIMWLVPGLGVVRILLTLFLLGALGHTTLMAWAAELHLRTATWILMSIILSIALVILAGIALNFTPWGLQPFSWLAVVSGLIIVQVFVGLLRRSPAPADMPGRSIRSWNLEFKPMQLVSLLLAIAIAITALLVARTGAITQPRNTFSQLWMVPSQENPAEVSLGIKNEEMEAIPYRLIIRQGSTVIHEYSNLLLQVNETWQDSLDVGVGRPLDLPIIAELYRPEEPNQPYRTASIWLK